MHDHPWPFWSIKITFNKLQNNLIICQHYLITRHCTGSLLYWLLTKILYVASHQVCDSYIRKGVTLLYSVTCHKKVTP